jgi:RNA polymerase sigma-70 factor (ECF subfamily)
MNFEATYKRLYAPLFHYCNKILSRSKVLDHEEAAKDFVSEAFVAAYNKWNDFADLEHVKSYVYVVARNKALNHLTALKRHEISCKEILYLNPEAEQPGFIDYDMINADVINFIWCELQKLPPQCQKITTLYFKGFSSHEIAGQLHLTIKTALNQKLKAIGIIKKALRLRFG